MFAVKELEEEREVGKAGGVSIIHINLKSKMP